MNDTPKPYHHGNLRQALLDAAYEQARSVGPQALRLRSLAQRTHVTPNAVYRHFAGQEDILRATKERIGGELVEVMRTYMEQAANTGPTSALSHALNRLYWLCYGYIAFARSEPGLFRTASSPETTQLQTFDQMQANPPFQLLKETLAPLIEINYVDTDHALQAEVSLWATVHGLAVLLLDSSAKSIPASEQERLIEYVLWSALRGIEEPQRSARSTR